MNNTYTNETRADILREMRETAGNSPVLADYRLIREYADRLEAAAKRDAAIHAMTCEANERLREHLEIALESKQGNAAAMREALERAIDAIQTMIALYDEEHTAAIQIGATWERSDTSVVNEIVEQAIAALAAHSRNCDRYGDEDDAFAAWHDALNDGDVVSVRNAFAWLFAKAEGGPTR